MQFRFRVYDEENQKYNLITYTDIEDYNTMFKTLTFMVEHECKYPIELNTEDTVETVGRNYYVTNVSLCIGEDTGEDRLLPHFVVDLEEEIG